MSGTVDFEGVKAALGTALVLDVRNRDEVEEHGQIEGASCIPFSELEAALALDDGAFAEKYGLQKPAPDAAIITHCMKGGRAQKAADALVAKNFTNIKVYCGSFTDWAAQGGDIKPGKPFVP